MSPLSDWTVPLLPAEVVREADRHAIEDLGLPGVDLMERAASALAEEVGAVAPEGDVVIVCGKGNNGGDGLAAARILRQAGRIVHLFATCDAADWAGDARTMLDLLGASGPDRLPGSLPGCRVVVDCVLGTGFAGVPRGPALDAIRLIEGARAAGAAVVSCDVPSGVDATSGEVPGDAVSADMTVSFHAMKPGHWIRPGKAHCGQVRNVDIGIPGSLAIHSVGLIADAVCQGLPSRSAEGDKFVAGSVLVAGGSPGLTGAPILAGLGAARGGAGYVTLALPEPLLSASDSVPELMGFAVAAEEGGHCMAGCDAVLSRSARAGAVVLGPGLGRTAAAQAFAKGVASACPAPLVIDADAIRAFAGSNALLADRSHATVITPHVAELAALLAIDTAHVSARRLDSAVRAAREFGAIVVLKGDDTLICAPDGEVAVSPGGSPSLATAGSGDVLGGLVAALLARGVDPLRAASAAVAIHAEAGRLAAFDGSEGVLASDIACELPAARSILSGADGR